MNKPLSALALVAMLSGCANTLKQEQVSRLDAMSGCEKVNLLVDNFPNGFDAIKQNKVSSKYGDIWQANYNLVGDNCQITSLSSAKSTYQCNAQYSDQTQSELSFQQATKLIAQCLSNDWKQTSTSQNNANKMVFKHPQKQAVITIMNGQTLAKYKKTWQTSFSVGAIAK